MPPAARAKLPGGTKIQQQKLQQRQEERQEGPAPADHPLADMGNMVRKLERSQELEAILGA